MKHKVLHILVPILFAAALVWGFFNVLPMPAIAKDRSTPVNPDSVDQIQADYNEAPMLAALVAAGQLPPVAERLPVEDDIVAITPVDGEGIYGGVWHNVTWWQVMGNIQMIFYDPPIRWKADYSGYEPGLLKSWDLSTDGMTLTWQLRQGLKWSDGALFTSEDLQFWWEDLALNASVTNVDVPWWGYNSDGSPMTVTFPTSMTMIMNWDEPNYIAPYIVAQGYWEWLPMERPKHFLSPYHPDYNPGATYDDLENMVYGQDWLANVEGYPCLHAWCPGNVVTG